MYRTWRFLLGALILGLCQWGATTPLYAHHTEVDSAEQAAIVLPPNFVARTIASGLTLPTDMVILPSGDILVTEKGTGAGAFSMANLRLVRNGVLRPEPILTLGVNAEEDSGLMGIVLDPDFANNHYFYLWYSTGEGALGWQGTSYNRLSRFVFDVASGTVDPASETIIYDKVRWAAIHNGGGLAFADDGTLIISTGDAASDYNVPAYHLSQNMKSLNGKLLRILPLEEGGYAVPPDNPFVGNTDGIPEEIYASGLRNPFRITRRAADQGLYFIDVGQATWEEVNLAVPGANYGWPYREGKCRIAQREDCDPTPPEYTDPVLSYIHPLELGSGATALAFYEGNAWPAQYQGKLFLADYNSDWVGTADLNEPDPQITLFARSVGSVVDIEATNEGLYFLSISDGRIRFIYHDQGGNQPPTVSLKSVPVQGRAPLTVTFTATATDQDGDALQYVWNFGDGQQITTTQPTISHGYLADGDYLATLQVVDNRGGKSEIVSQSIQVYSGAHPTIAAKNQTEPGRRLYNGGDQFVFSAVRSGGTSGLDPVKPYAWTILLHHNDHVHFLVAEFVGSEVVLDIPVESHAVGSPLSYEIILTMRTEGGQTIRTSYVLRPQTTTIQVASWPGPTPILLNQQELMPGDTMMLIVGEQHILEAPERIVHQGNVGLFKNWVVTPSWPAASSVDEAVIVPDRVFALTAQPEAYTYIAFYEYYAPATFSYFPTVRKAAGVISR